jgi:hypothetical protein
MSQKAIYPASSTNWTVRLGFCHRKWTDDHKIFNIQELLLNNVATCLERHNFASREHRFFCLLSFRSRQHSESWPPSFASHRGISEIMSPFFSVLNYWEAALEDWTSYSRLSTFCGKILDAQSNLSRVQDNGNDRPLFSRYDWQLRSTGQPWRFEARMWTVQCLTVSEIWFVSSLWQMDHFETEIASTEESSSKEWY